MALTLGEQAARLGHKVEVARVTTSAASRRGTAERFRLVCSCGFATSAQMKRKTAFNALTVHLTEVIADAKARVAN